MDDVSSIILPLLCDPVKGANNFASLQVHSQGDILIQQGGKKPWTTNITRISTSHSRSSWIG